MITPFEIEHKEFSKSMRGYNVEEVDVFLDEIILDLQKLLAEKEKLQESVKSLENDLNQYKRSEASVLNTLESAKKLMNDISESAEKRAEIIIHNAQAEADSIQRDARESISKLTEEGDKLKHKVTKFRERFRQLLEDQLNQMEGSSEELFDDLEREFMPASMEPDETAASHTETLQRKPAFEAQPKDKFDTVFETKTVTKGKAPSFSASKNPAKRTSLDETLVISDKALEEMLMENFGVRDSGNSGPAAEPDDLSKTRIVR